eukprot:8288191-Alexandrium_andersonii.AAC.1
MLQPSGGADGDDGVDVVASAASLDEKLEVIADSIRAWAPHLMSLDVGDVTRSREYITAVASVLDGLIDETRADHLAGVTAPVSYTHLRAHETSAHL